MNPNSSPQVPPFHGSCPQCDYGRMFPLARFFESDVNDTPTVDSFMPSRGIARFFPGLSLFLMISTWLGALIWGRAKVERGRAKVRRAREEILPRSPNAVICPNCFEVLERL